MPQNDPGELLQCLMEAREALLSGDFASLTNLTERTENALELGAHVSEPTLLRLRTVAEENRDLLESALRGIRAAKRRASDLTEAGRFSTYEQGGKRNQHGLPSIHRSIRL